MVPNCGHFWSIIYNLAERKNAHVSLDIVLAGSHCIVAELHAKLSGRVVHAPCRKIGLGGSRACLLVRVLHHGLRVVTVLGLLRVLERGRIGRNVGLIWLLLEVRGRKGGNR